MGADKYLRYGPIGLNLNSFSNNLYKSIISGQDFKIFGNDHKTLDDTPVKDFIHVDDLANIHFESLKYLIKNKENQICNCGYGKGYSIEQVIKTLPKNKEMNLNYSFSKNETWRYKLYGGRYKKIR